LGSPTFKTVSSGGLAWLECQRLGRFPWLLHAFSTRQGGHSPAPCAGLNLGFTDGDRRERVERNRQDFLAQIGAKNYTLAPVRQIHSSRTYVVARDEAGQIKYRFPGVAVAVPTATDSPAGDASMTAEAGILLGVRIADCLPVLLVDSQKRVVAAVHAGWRGALARVIEKAVGDMRHAFGSDPQRIIAALGPSIRTCCFEVGEEVVEAFHGRFAHADKFLRAIPRGPGAASDRGAIPFLSDYPPGHAPEHVPAAHLDLVAVAEDQLSSAGVKPSNILVADYCTSCRTDLFFSHRKEGGCTGRQMAVIGILPSRIREGKRTKITTQ
jgi:YfiH family protein